MKQLIIVLVLTAQLGAVCQGQVNLQEFNKERYAINQKAFIVLGSWSAANIITGIVGQSSTTGEAKYFHQMDIIWGSVNLLLAVPGYIGARKSPTDMSMANAVRGQGIMEKTFAFNAGLDLAYIAGGAWYAEKGNSSVNRDKYRGYGKSIMMQGAFLFLMDAVMFATHNHHGKKLIKVLDTVQLAPNRLGLRLGI